MPGWRDRLRSALGRGPGGREMFDELRSIALTVEPATLSLPAGEWSGAFLAMIEIGTPSGVATFVAVADGSVSMYTSTGGGIIGAGDHESVRAAARQFLREASESTDILSPSADFPLPAPGEVRFQVRTSAGGFTGAAAASALRDARHPLFRLHAAGQDLITDVRRMSEEPPT